ncbi:hypothetical protein [Nocardia bovistercoris]|uniref:Uncharacterized protein n=1 Tax=Nocardia bovistercoris TaxID=2785916 RepID=A0A931IFP0_9NOCA|nr:hypothetical protein [Nocardia bovistercoris]MBH0778833.1 hypothetical protein [Nocardia bovistercoris]
MGRVYAGDVLIWSAAQNASDDFNRASLGSNWVTLGISSAGIVPVINANRLRNAPTTVSNTRNQSAALFSAAPAVSDNHMVRATLASAVNGLYSGLILRASVDFQNMVVAMLTTDSAATGIWTFIGGTSVRRVSTSTSTFAANDVAGFKAEGSLYTLVKNPDGANTTVATWNDTGALYLPSSSRRLGGAYLTSDSNVVGTQNWSPALDDFNIRDI